jgi:hypothetical protein
VRTLHQQPYWIHTAHTTNLYRPDVEVGRMFFDNLGRNKRLNSYPSLDVSLRQLGESWNVTWRRLRVI